MPSWSCPVDLSRSSRLLAVRLVVSVIAALAIAFWLQVQDPQWAGLTACLVIQPTAGAVVAKSVFRIIGTVVGALFGLFALSHYAEAPFAFVGLITLWLAVATYGAARVRNFTAYGFLLAGYSALLVGFEGLASPTGAWTIAVDRSAEILIGIGCSMAVAVTLAPVHAGDVLRRSLRQTFSGLADYAAKALDVETPLAVFSTTRREMIADVAKFDALRSYTAFESSEFHAQQGALRRVTRSFLGVLAVARSVHFRITELHQEAAAPTLAHVAPVLAEVAAVLKGVSAGAQGGAVAQQIHHDLLGARRRLLQGRETLALLAGTLPFDELADSLLILSRTNDMVRRLSTVMAAETGGLRRRGPVPHRGPAPPALERTEAILQAARAGLALLLVTGFWSTTGWSAGFSAVSGVAIIVFFLVNQENPGKIAWPYIGGVALGYLAALLAIAFVLPWLEDFTGLAIFLGIVLLPAGLMMNTPRFASSAVGFAAFFVAGIANGNRFDPDPQSFVNNAIALLLGLVAFLFVSSAILPVSPQRFRRRAWRQIVAVMASAAQGSLTGRAAARDVLTISATLLLRLDLTQQREEELLRGCLGAASTCIEIGRIHRVSDATDLPPAIITAIRNWLGTIATMYQELQKPSLADPVLTRGEAATRDLYGALAAAPVALGSPQARLMVRTAASLRFVIDRFDSDRAFLRRGSCSASAGAE